MEQTISTTYEAEEFKAILAEVVNTAIKKLYIFTPPPETELLTRKDTAILLGISLPTLNDWTKRGLIPSFRISSRVRYKKTEVLNSLTKVKTLKYKKDQ